MSGKEHIIVSLDVSASSTGWCALGRQFMKHGIIKTSPKMNRSERLKILRDALVCTVFVFEPTHVVIEDTFSGLNPKTLKILSEFSGVAKEACQDVLGIDPYVISTNTVKAYFKTKGKEDMFNFVVKVLGFEKNNLTFKKDNDIIDAIGMVMCYADSVLNLFNFRETTDYGYRY